MSIKQLFFRLACVGIAPAALWSLVSLATAAFSVLVRPVSLSPLLQIRENVGAFQYCELPVLTALAILAGCALLIFGIASISRSH